MPKILCFPYFGPNRRSDRRVLEIRLDFSSEEAGSFPQTAAEIMQVLHKTGMVPTQESGIEESLPEERIHWYSMLLAKAALWFQRANGHRVDFHSVSCDPVTNQCLALVEHEHSKVGVAAVQLAMEIFSGHLLELPQACRSFSKFAMDLALPIETEHIMSAALSRNVPVFQLEHEPLAGHFNTGHRIRRNGLLSLGHGAARHILDGTFCVDKADDFARALLQNPGQRMALLARAGVPTAPTTPAETGDTSEFLLLIINGNVTAIEQRAHGSRRVARQVHESMVQLCKTISGHVGSAPVCISVMATSIEKPLEETGGFVQGFELAPDLGLVLNPGDLGPALIESAAGDLIDWLFPDTAQACMPVIAITGTNGKTTTSRMIAHIMQSSGRRPGLVCTDGIFFSGKQFSTTDAGSFLGHARVLTSQHADIAVLESHHRGIAIRGFAFQRCDVAVCLNVTQDHLRDGEIETVGEMAEIKRALVERASGAAILFADDARCRDMLDFVNAERICLVSCKSGIEQLRELAGRRPAVFCVLEMNGHTEWIVWYGDGQRLPVIPVKRIPATIDGTARFNVSNSMHAIAAGYLSGVGIERVANAMENFRSGIDTTPGRLNIFDGLPFRVVMDYAHNADGFRKIVEFADAQNIAGRKILMVGYSGDRRDRDIKAATAPLAGHFDHYVCRNFRILRDRQPGEIPALLKAGFMAHGVAEAAISNVPEAEEALRYSLSIAGPGDLVVLLVGATEFKSAWNIINSHEPGSQAFPR